MRAFRPSVAGEPGQYAFRGRRHIQWTRAMLQILRECFPAHGAAETVRRIAEACGVHVTLESVRKRAYAMGLRRLLVCGRCGATYVSTNGRRVVRCAACGMIPTARAVMPAEPEVDEEIMRRVELAKHGRLDLGTMQEIYDGRYVGR